MDFKTVDKTKWEAIAPPAKAVKEDKYAPVLDALEAGEIIQIETADNKEAKGLRISIARKASGRGFRVEYRAEGNILYVKKTEEPATPAEQKPRKQKEKVVV